jgi:hypothetical protein
MGVDGKSEGPYVVTTYRGSPGHRAQLDDTIEKVQASAAKPDRGVVLRHVEGGNWDSLVISRYDSWTEFAADMTDAGSDQRERRAGLTQPAWQALREHSATHNDSVAVRVAIPAAR